MGRQDMDGNADAGGDTGRDGLEEGAEVGQDGDGLDGDGDGGGGEEDGGDGGDGDGQDGDGDGDGQDGDGDDGDAGDGHAKGKDAGVKFSPEQQRAVNGLLAKESRRRKEAEDKLGEAGRELEDYRKRYGDGDPETVLAAARSAGVMPELMTAAEAEGVTKLENAKANSKYFSRMMRRSGDEFDVGGKKMTREELEESADYWEAEAERLETRFSGVKARAARDAQDIWKLGQAAKKAGWKPGAAARKPEDGTRRRGDAENGGLKPKGGGRTAPDGDGSGTRVKAAGGGGRVDWGAVGRNEMSLEEAIAKSERMKK